MPIYTAALGAIFLAYVVWAISGLGLAVLTFLGIMLIVHAMYQWFLQTRNNSVHVFKTLVKEIQKTK
jgi:hypothetical protein